MSTTQYQVLASVVTSKALCGAQNNGFEVTTEGCVQVITALMRAKFVLYYLPDGRWLIAPLTRLPPGGTQTRFLPELSRSSRLLPKSFPSRRPKILGNPHCSPAA